MALASRSRLRPEQRRQQILRCARALFVTQGFEAVTSALVHHYFGGKRELYLVVAREIVEMARDVSTTIAQNDYPLEAHAAATIDAWLSFVAREGEAWLAVTAHGAAVSDPEIRTLVSEARDTCVQRMLRTYGDHIVDTPTTRFALRSFVHLNEAVSREWLNGDVSREQAQEFLTHTLLDILLRVASAADVSRRAHTPLSGSRKRIAATAQR
jgi:AcrR family transcriptional regulator